MRGLIFLFCILAGSLTLAGPLSAQERLSGLARLMGQGVTVETRGEAVEIAIEMTRSVPWRVFTLDDPARMVVDFSELDWRGTDGDALAGAHPAIAELRTGLFRPGWSRMVVSLATPMAVESAAMTRADAGEGARVGLRLVPTTPEDFARAAGAPASAMFSMKPVEIAPPAREGGPLVVVLDPGHGGIDPGAEREGVREADLMLTFARELKEALLRTGNVDVVLTRDEDVFVPLEERVTRARAAQADLFISLHADALAQGRANGATVYTLSSEASDVASQKLAERHDRDDLLAGVDLAETDDAVALVLMSMARVATEPRSDALADALVEGFFEATGSTYKTPRLKAGFSVLKAPDMPSVLVELGFLSSKRDREKLIDPAWRAQAAQGMRDAILRWAEADPVAARRLSR